MAHHSDSRIQLFTELPLRKLDDASSLNFDLRDVLVPLVETMVLCGEDNRRLFNDNP